MSKSVLKTVGVSKNVKSEYSLKLSAKARIVCLCEIKRRRKRVQKVYRRQKEDDTHFDVQREEI
jgi:hypothetical protein